MNYDEILCRRIQEVEPFGIRCFLDILEEMRDTIPLGVGESDFVTLWHIRDVDIYSLEKGFIKYTSNVGMVEPYREIVAYLNRRFGLQYDLVHQIVVIVGGSETVDLALRRIPNPGDEVIIPVPSFVCYGSLTSMARDTPVHVELKAENEFRLIAAQFRAALIPRIKAVVLPFPSNPIGGILERANLEALAGVLKDTNAMVLSDEIYAELIYGQKYASPADLSELYNRTIVVNGFSKSHAMIDWYTGYVCGPTPILQQIFRLHQFGIMSAPTTSQYAVIEVMHNGDVDIEKIRDEYNGRRRCLVEGLRCIGLLRFESKGAFYVFPDIWGIGLTSDELCGRFLMEEKVAVISGSAFDPGGEGFIRCCYAISIKDIAEVLTCMDNFLTSLCKKQAQEG